jgi:maltoporin
MRSARIGIGLAALITVCGHVASGQAQSDGELGQIRQQMEQLKQDYADMSRAYQERLKLLDQRLQQLEAANAQPSALPVALASVHPVPHLPASTASPSSVSQASPPVQNQDQGKSSQPRDPFSDVTDSIQISIAQQEENRVRERMETVLRNYIDITGYFRAGYGRDNQGGPQVGFQAPGALAKARLGNEAENYGELTFAKTFYLPGVFSLTRNSSGAPSSRPLGHFQVRVSMYNPYQNYNVPSATNFGIAEAWGAIGHVNAAQPGMTVWAGDRFYRRHDIHINDFFIYNMSGGGGGIEDIKVPFGKLALAWIGIGSQSAFTDVPQPEAANKAGFSKNNFDIRLYDIGMLRGKAEIGVDLTHATSGKDQDGNAAPDSNGASVTFIHTSEKWAGESNLNKLYIQYGYGAAKTFTSGFETVSTSSGTFIRPDAPGSYRFRVADNIIFETGNHFTVSPVVLYQATDYKEYGGKQYWFAGGLRPQVHFTDYLNVALEPFVDWTDNKSTGVSDYLFKLTFAPQVSLGRHFMSRPAIRGFVTYAQWGDGFKGKIGGPDYITNTQGLTWGAQMESWW